MLHRRALSLALLAGVACSVYQGFVGPYHPSNATVYDTFMWGGVAIENAVTDASWALEADVNFHCGGGKDVNSVMGMLLAHSEGGLVNVPNDTDVWRPATPHAGLVQGAARWSTIARTSCPQVQGVVIDDFLGNYGGGPRNQSGWCARCPPDAPVGYGSRTSGRFCCPWPLSSTRHCVAPPAAAPAPRLCCLLPSYNPDVGCQGVPRCGVNPGNHSVCNPDALTLDDVRDIKGALLGKVVDPVTGAVDHASPATTPHLQLWVVWYTSQTRGFEDDGLLSEGLVDGVNLWLEGPAQAAQAANYTAQVAEFRAVAAAPPALRPAIPVIGGSYLQHSRMGWLDPPSFRTMLAQSVEMYDAGQMDGFYVFSGTAIDELNATQWAEWALPDMLGELYFPWLGQGTVNVTDANSGAPVAGATVTVSRCASAGGRCGHVTRKVSDAHGGVVFGGWAGKHALSPHTISVAAHGYRNTSGLLQLQRNRDAARLSVQLQQL